ncbi:acetate--CoA ligase family protein [Methanolobus sp. ZRKC3]
MIDRTYHQRNEQGKNSSQSIEFFFKPNSIAVIGASPSPEKNSRVIMESLERIGFKGNVYPVNPKYSSIGGLKCYSSIADIDDIIDVAVFATPAPVVLEVLKGNVENLRGAIIISSGFKEIDDEGRRLEEEIQKITRAKGIRVIGPNCMGIYDTISKIDTFFVSGDMLKRPGKGSISILTQSGSFALMIMDEMAADYIGVARVVSYGNRMDVDEVDCLNYLMDDDDTRAIAIYIESLDNGRLFVEAASRCSKKKPIVAIKVGKGESAMRAAKSHTGAIAGRYEIYKAAFHRAGIIEVEGYERLKDAFKILNSYEPVKGKNVLIVTDGGGIGISVVDACEELGLVAKELTYETGKILRSRLYSFSAIGNPIDLTGSVKNEDYFTALEEGLKDGYDIAIVTLLWGPPGLNEGVVERLKDAKKRFRTPIIICSPGGEFTRQMVKVFEKNGLPVFPSPESAARAAHVISGYTRKDHSITAENEISSAIKDKIKGIVHGTLEQNRMNLLESEAKILISSMGIRVPKSVNIEGKGKIPKGKMKPPFVLKVVSKDILHKTEVGGVCTDIESIEDAEKALKKMRVEIAEKAPQAKIDCFLLEEMITDGVEVIIGGLRDPQFGPVLMFGIGGVAVELMKDVSFRLAPVNREEAIEMMQEIKGFPLLTGFRGQKQVDVEAVASVISRISELLMEVKEIEEIEINPLMATESDAVAVDARVLLNPANKTIHMNPGADENRDQRL